LIVVFWTPERGEKLRLLVAKGLSFSQIAQEIGDGITRNAVCGKMKRLGLKSRNTCAFEPKKRLLRPRVQKQKVSIFATRWGAFDKDTKPPEHTHAESVVSDPLYIPLERLNNITCRWPYGESTPYRFCGCATMKAPYCEAHTAQSIGRGTTSERLAAYAPKEVVAA
jgi:GcrA cell cycle regulator